MSDTPTWTVPWGTKDYVMADMTSLIDGVTLGDQPVEIRVSPAAWQTAEWVDAEDQTNVVRSSSVFDFATLSRSILHPVYVRFTDAPAVPIVKVGQFRVEA